FVFTRKIASPAIPSTVPYQNTIFGSIRPAGNALSRVRSILTSISRSIRLLNTHEEAMTSNVPSKTQIIKIQSNSHLDASQKPPNVANKFERRMPGFVSVMKSFQVICDVAD